MFWFAVAAPVLVAEVFRSPLVDYRLVIVGALLPLVEAAAGRPSILHTLIGSVALLFLVMVTTVNRRLLRRRLLGLPIGMFLHLVLDGTWTDSELFWWPAFGTDLPSGLPVAGRSPLLLIGMELAAVGLAVWAWRRYGLASPANRSLLVREGHLAREVLR
ncbi:MAG: hypothetical protein OEV40_21095 [Acidimicrobiia bacterium]|nr:hypothetical protein [Acidimicrobiia bacterium]